MSLRNPLDRFETLAQQLIEGSLGWLLGGRLDPVVLAAELASAVETDQRDGRAPNAYTIRLHPADYAYLRLRWPETAAALVGYVIQVADRLRLRLDDAPQIDLHAGSDIGRHMVQIHAHHRLSVEEDQTQPFQPAGGYNPLAALQQLDAFLIVGGQRHAPLDRPTLTIGRHPENDLVLGDRAVSRRHAQLRWRFGRFVLTDLGSRGGVFVNNLRIDECVLRPGDVIRLGETTLIYGEGETAERAEQPADATATQVQPRSDRA